MSASSIIYELVTKRSKLSGFCAMHVYPQALSSTRSSLARAMISIEDLSEARREMISYGSGNSLQVTSMFEPSISDLK